jgi:hypothetical protein
MHYIQRHLPSILEDYTQSQSYTGRTKEKIRLLQLKVKIGSKNEESIKLFESIGFLKVEEGPNYFGEFELVFEGFLGEDRTKGMLKRWDIEGYREMKYVRGG